MNKHWTRFLIEGRRIFLYSYMEQERLSREIQEMETKLNGLKKLHELNEEDIFRDALKQYSIEEITDAKIEAKCTTI